MYPYFDKGGNDGNGDFQIAIRSVLALHKKYQDARLSVSSLRSCKPLIAKLLTGPGKFFRYIGLGYLRPTPPQEKITLEKDTISNKILKSFSFINKINVKVNGGSTF